MLLLTIAAAALRFGTLDVQSVWLDEAATISLVHRGLTGMLAHLGSSESAPPLYYLLIWAWTKVLGAGPLGFRSFSALMGALTVPVLYMAGRHASTRIGLWAAALATVSPALYYYSQEARGYALLILLNAAAFVVWLDAMQDATRKRLALWSGLSVLSLLTHYFAVFMFIPEAVMLIRRHGWRRLTIPVLPVIAVGIALVPLALKQRTGGQSDWIQTTSLASRIAQAPKQYLIGLYSPQEIVTALLAGLLAAGALALIARRAEEKEKQVARLVALVGIGALAIPLALAVTHIQDVFNGRNVMAAWSPWAVLIAIGVGAAGARRAGATLGVALCALSLAVIVAVNAEPGYQRDDWRGIASALGSATSGRVLVTGKNSELPLSVYLSGITTIRGRSAIAAEVDFLALRTERTGRSPTPPMVFTRPPPGFMPAGIQHTDTYAISRFVAYKAAIVVDTRTLRRLAGDAEAEVLAQR